MQVLNLELREQMIDLYVNKKLSTREIAKRLTKTERTISRWIKEFGIPKREKKELEIPILKNKNWFLEIYVKQKKTCKEIGDMVNLSDERIRQALIEHGIPRRRGEKKINIDGSLNKKQQPILVKTRQHGTWSALL